MTSFGAIRWDAYYANGSGPSRYTSQSLSAAAYRGRAPKHADVSKTKVLWAYSQDTMDAEIAVAKASNLKYWAFLRYAGGSDMNVAYDLYQSSANKNDVKYCWIDDLNRVGSTGNYTAWVSLVVARMGDSNWFKAGGRPVIYLYWSDAAFAAAFGGVQANVKAAVDALRAAAANAGVGDPYVVLMAGFTALSRAILRVGVGADALSDYISTNIPQALKAPYSALDTAVRGHWATLAAAGQVVPICMAGWDRRPRIDRPVAWEATTQRAGVGMLNYVAQPTNAELVAHLQAAKDYISANPSVCPLDVALIYAWNEHDEGGWIAPTVGDPSGAKLSAIASVLA